MALAVARDPGGFGEIDDPVSFGDEGRFESGRRPLEGAGRALGAEGLTELLGLGADVGDGLVNGAAIRTQKNTPPKESYALRGVLCVGDYARTGPDKSRPGAAGPVVRCASRLHNALYEEPDATRKRETRGDSILLLPSIRCRVRPESVLGRVHPRHLQACHPTCRGARRLGRGARSDVVSDR